MKAVLISIQPKWCELIASGKKTVEVRKTKPKLETPFKVYIYETRNGGHSCKNCKENAEDCYSYAPKGVGCYNGRSKVIGEFVCDRVIGTCPWRLKGETGFCAKRTEEETQLPDMACLTLEEIEKYAGSRGRGLYGWHISDLKIYDKPRELSEFATICKIDEKDAYECSQCEYFNTPEKSIYKCLCNHLKPLTRPPQSWCYVEEQE